jgi:hypothetical protein
MAKRKNRSELVIETITVNSFKRMFGGGRFATVTFVKKSDNSIRVLNGKTKVVSEINGNGNYDAESNGQVRVCDVNLRDKNGKRTKGYRTVTIANIIDVRANGVIYKVADTTPELQFITKVELLPNNNVVVEMFGQKRYEYINVWKHMAEKFKDAENKGAFFNDNIKGKYNYVKLSDAR